MGSFDPIQTVVLAVLLVAAVLVGLCTTAVFLYCVYFLLTLPMRRNERARLFLELLELGLKNGRTAEQAIIEAASSRDRALGVRFHWLAQELQAGMSLERALDQVTRLLPPQIIGMLRAGARLGDISKVLPACRLCLRDGVSHVRGALNYLLLLGFILAPLSLTAPIVLRLKVLPQFRAVFRDIAPGLELPALTRFVFEQNGWFMWLQLLFLVGTWLILICYIGGPRLRAWLRPVLGDFPDWLELWLPWRRKRMQRDFSAMLAILIDAGVPEAEAVTLAAESLANQMMLRRARRVRARLSEGAKLQDALRAMDASAELQWRLSNALQRGGGFLRALTGWHEALDSKAFQLEQTAAQLATTALVLVNGLVIGLFVVGMFMALLQILNNPALW
jgi:type IV pilus assembly protein PilC